MVRVQKGSERIVINGKTILAIIPARGGSKRLPRKNVLPLSGKPLIVWTIEAGLNSKYIDRVIVSSEDVEILKISVDAGSEIIQRPQKLATDKASTFSVVEHVINEIDGHYDFIILLQPSSPLRSSKHIDNAFDLLVAKDADGIISVCKTEHSPLWANILPEDGSMVQFIKGEIKGMRSQNLPIYYRLNGAIYLCKKDKLISEKSFLLKENIFAYQMNRRHSVDIDEKFDFDLAEHLMEESD